MNRSVDSNIATLQNAARRIAYDLCLRGHAICHLDEVYSEAVLHLLECQASPYSFYDARTKTMRWIKRATGRRKDGTPKGYRQTPTGIERPIPDESDATGQMDAYDHERTMRRLPERHRQVLAARLGGAYQWQIAYQLGVTEARVCQIERSARQRYRRLVVC